MENFALLVRRMRCGDADAAEELVRLYEADLRIIARARLFDPRLRQVVDSMDICQSIFGNFFARAYAGQFDIDSPEQLKKLLSKMVRNKVTDYARRSQAQSRQANRQLSQDAGDVEGAMLVDSQPSVTSLVAAKDIADEFRKRMTDDEREILQRRLMDMNWEDIGKALNANADAIRKKFARAMDRIAVELGIEDE
jgi:RNA polymerase sigma-70 factor (ECF subfamily)